MVRRYVRRLTDATFAAALMSLRQALRQQWFLLTFVPFALVVLAAPLMPAPSETAAYRLLVRIVLSGGSVILFLGVILSASAALPSEIRDRTAFRSIASPGGRLTALTGRIGAFVLLAGFVAGLGFLATLAIYAVRAGGSEEFCAASEQHRTIPARSHTYGGAPVKSSVSGVLWIDEKARSLTWTFSPDAVRLDKNVRIQLVPVVASAVETTAMLSIQTQESSEPVSMTVVLFDNRPTSVTLDASTGPKGTGSLHVSVEHLPDSSPFGFDVRRDEFGSERNGVSLLAGARPFTLNLLFAWFVVWVKLSFAVTVAVFASTFLGGPIAAALSLVMYLLANALGFLREFGDSIGKLTHVHAHIHHGAQELNLPQQALKVFLAWFTEIYPDLSRFDPTEALIWGRAIPVGFIALALAYYLAYSLMFCGASALVLRRREF